MRPEDCKKCCWCGFAYPKNYDFNDFSSPPIHMCTGEEKYAKQCPKMNECWKVDC